MTRIIHTRHQPIWLVAGILSFLMLLSACAFSADKKPTKAQASPDPEKFKVPEVPIVLNTPEQRADYLMEHYWDNFNFNNTNLISKPKVSEQAFADFINILLQLPSEKTDKGIRFLMGKAEVNGKMYQYFLELSEKYLYDPNSPVRNEVLYDSFLKAALSSDILDDAHKIRPAQQYELAQKNKAGQKATDFKYTLKNGSTSRLYDIQAKLLLIYFNNPGCEECKAVREKILASSALQELIGMGTLKVLALYPDEDLAEWNKYYADIPSGWINAYNKGAIIKNKELYDLKAIPTLYLLDREKRVLLKDARFEEIEAYILNH